MTFVNHHKKKKSFHLQKLDLSKKKKMICQSHSFLNTSIRRFGDGISYFFWFVEMVGGTFILGPIFILIWYFISGVGLLD